ncbi:unnamed protein product [Paramecium sonneborni]|uniref:PCI domain-containing protein n=1 Tax=Paramecium sonneborni TaxID=65129 RepID=A0A8S1L7F8_9CILI|nr:unnamed protein product [Paramecium sonneborni]
MIAKKSENILLIILRFFREGKCFEAMSCLKRIFSGKEQSLLGLDLVQTLKQLRLENESEACKKLNENTRQSHPGWVELLCSLLQYYMERERGSAQVIEHFENLFKNSKWLLDEQRHEIYQFLCKQVVTEQYKIVQIMKRKAKDSEAVKEASHAQEKLESKSLQIFQEMGREVNIKNMQKLKLLNANQQMKIYFKAFKFDSAAACDKVEKEQNLLLASPKQDQITYHYYKGRILIFDSKFYEASQHLTQVLQECPRTQKGLSCARQVLKYLIPINMFIGRYPNKELIDQFKEYELLCTSVRQGNISGLQEAIDKYRSIWIKRSLLILMDQLKVLCYRNLCRKVWLINQQANKIHLEQFQKAFRISHPANSNPTISEVCCIIANLIYLELIRGHIYLNNEKNIYAITLSPQQPFKDKPGEIKWQQ